MKPVSKWGQLKKLYDALPTMQCKPGCTDCCGPVPWTSMERARLDKPQPTCSQHCPEINWDAPEPCCGVYEFRPFMCRLYGVSDALPCPHGCGPEKRLTKEETAKLRDEYAELKATVLMSRKK